MPRHRDIYRSLNPKAKKPTTCHMCGSTTYTTKDGRYYIHRMPPLCHGYNLPLRSGPICKASGFPAHP